MAVRPEDLASSLRRRHRLARQHSHDRAQDLRARLKDELERLAKKGHVWIIGSLASGAFGVRSDVDLVVDDMTPDDACTLWDRLEQRLGVPVDLMRLEDLSPEFRSRVLAEGIPVRGT